MNPLNGWGGWEIHFTREREMNVKNYETSSHLTSSRETK